jgi:hypothetical protein
LDFHNRFHHDLERNRFLEFHIKKGVLKNVPDEDFHGYGYPEPEGFSDNLVDWIKDEFALHQLDIHRLIRYGKYCYTSRYCIDMNDIGSLCCPF